MMPVIEATAPSFNYNPTHKSISCTEHNYISFKIGENYRKEVCLFTPLSDTVHLSPQSKHAIFLKDTYKEILLTDYKA
jgi:hypothetical protein